MNEQSDERANAFRIRKPLWRRVLKWTIRVVVAVVVVAAVGWGIFSYVSAKVLEAEIDKLRAAGQPMTFAEWEKSRPKVAEADDAAPFYKAALALRRRPTDTDVAELGNRLRDPSNREGPLPGDLVGEIEQVLGDNALALEMVDRGSALPQCAYDFGLSAGIGGMLPQLGEVRDLAWVLRLRTKYLARQGRTDEAVESLVSNLRMLRMFERQPILITHLVKIACAALCVGAVPAVLEARPSSKQDLAELESALAEADLSKGMDRVWVFERVYALEIKRNLIGGRGISLPGRPALPEAAPRASFLGRPFLRLMVADLLRTYDGYAEACRRDWPEALDRVRAVSRRRRGVLGLFSKMLAPSYEKAFVLTGRIIGQVRSAQVAVMVERYRLAKGKLPASLEELRAFVGAGLPADPFTGGELVYRVDEGGYAVYSVSDDKVDDGGPEKAPRKDFGVVVRRAR